MFKKFAREIVAAAGLAAAIGSANAQLVVGNDATGGQLWVVDVTLGINTRSLGTGTDFQVGGLAANNAPGRRRRWC